MSTVAQPRLKEGGDEKSLERLRWRCRRGLLELDIVLGRFVAQCYSGLDEAQQITFDALLDLPDTVLWDLVAGRQEAAEKDQQLLLEKVRAV
jgi:antitoxin CptB